MGKFSAVNRKTHFKRKRVSNTCPAPSQVFRTARDRPALTKAQQDAPKALPFPAPSKAAQKDVSASSAWKPRQRGGEEPAKRSAASPKGDGAGGPSPPPRPAGPPAVPPRCPAHLPPGAAAVPARPPGGGGGDGEPGAVAQHPRGPPGRRWLRLPRAGGAARLRSAPRTPPRAAAGAGLRSGCPGRGGPRAAAARLPRETGEPPAPGEVPGGAGSGGQGSGSRRRALSPQGGERELSPREAGEAQPKEPLLWGANTHSSSETGYPSSPCNYLGIIKTTKEHAYGYVVSLPTTMLRSTLLRLCAASWAAEGQGKGSNLLPTELLLPYPQCTKCPFSSTSQFPVPRARHWAINVIRSEEERKKVLCRPGGGNEGSALRIRSFLFSQLLFSSPPEEGNTAPGNELEQPLVFGFLASWAQCYVYCFVWRCPMPTITFPHESSIVLTHTCFQRGVAGGGSLSITGMYFFRSISLSCWAVSQQRSLLVPGKQKCLSLNAGVQPDDGLRVVSTGKTFTYLWSSPY